MIATMMANECLSEAEALVAQVGGADEEERLTRALELYCDAVEHTPTAAVLSKRCALLLRLRAGEEAMADALRIMELAPSSASTFELSARALQMCGYRARARQSWEACLQLAREGRNEQLIAVAESALISWGGPRFQAFRR